MKYANTAAGYDMGKCRAEVPWWQHPFFPLAPQFEWREGDEWSANNWSFCWLWLRVWSLDQFAFELSAEVEQTGLNVKAIVGWVRIVFRVLPLPYGWLNCLRRKPAKPSNVEPTGSPLAASPAEGVAGLSVGLELTED